MFLYYRVVLQVSGGGITSESGSNLASMITENSNTLNVDIMEVSMGKKVPRWKGASISLDDILDQHLSEQINHAHYTYM